MGVEATTPDFLYWQRQALVPYPVKHRRAGATRAYYPAWVADLVRHLRRRQEAGRTLAELRPEMKTVARALSEGRPAAVAGVGIRIEVPAGRLEVIGAPATAVVHEDFGAGSAAGALSATPATFPPLAAALARAYEARFGGRIVRVEVRLIDERDRPASFTFVTDPPS